LLNGYKGDFGPVTSRVKNLVGSTTGGQQQFREINQAHQTMAKSLAFEQGGKTLTKAEIQAILDQTSDPNDAGYRTNFNNFRGAQVENLGMALKDIEDRGLDKNPTFAKRYQTLKALYDKASGQLPKPPSNEFPPGDQGAGTYNIGGKTVTVRQIK
jgi:hypothetical protein